MISLGSSWWCLAELFATQKLVSIEGLGIMILDPAQFLKQACSKVAMDPELIIDLSQG